MKKSIDKRKYLCIIILARFERRRKRGRLPPGFLYRVLNAQANMRLWRNWQTRTFEGRVGDRMGSSPISRTSKRHCKRSAFCNDIRSHVPENPAGRFRGGRQGAAERII